MTAFEPIPEEPEQIAGRRVGWMLGATVLAIAACAVVVWALQAFELPRDGRSDVVHVDLVLPTQPFSTLPAVRARPAALDQWTWADRQRRRVRLPVAVAIERYLAQQGIR